MSVNIVRLTYDNNIVIFGEGGESKGARPAIIR